MAERADQVAPDLVSRLQARNAKVTLPRHEVWMLRQCCEELIKWALLERDCFYNSITDGEGRVVDPEDAITLAEQDFEITRAQRTLRDFDKVFHG